MFSKVQYSANKLANFPAFADNSTFNVDGGVVYETLSQAISREENLILPSVVVPKNSEKASDEVREFKFKPVIKERRMAKAVRKFFEYFDVRKIFKHSYGVVFNYRSDSILDLSNYLWDYNYYYTAVNEAIENPKSKFMTKLDMSKYFDSINSAKIEQIMFRMIDNPEYYKSCYQYGRNNKHGLKTRQLTNLMKLINKTTENMEFDYLGVDGEVHNTTNLTIQSHYQHVLATMVSGFLINDFLDRHMTDKQRDKTKIFVFVDDIVIVSEDRFQQNFEHVLMKFDRYMRLNGFKFNTEKDSGTIKIDHSLKAQEFTGLKELVLLPSTAYINDFMLTDLDEASNPNSYMGLDSVKYSRLDLIEHELRYSDEFAKSNTYSEYTRLRAEHYFNLVESCREIVFTVNDMISANVHNMLIKKTIEEWIAGELNGSRSKDRYSSSNREHLIRNDIIPALVNTYIEDDLPGIASLIKNHDKQTAIGFGVIHGTCLRVRTFDRFVRNDQKSLLSQREFEFLLSKGHEIMNSTQDLFDIDSVNEKNILEVLQSMTLSQNYVDPQIIFMLLEKFPAKGKWLAQIYFHNTIMGRIADLNFMAVKQEVEVVKQDYDNVFGEFLLLVSKFTGRSVDFLFIYTLCMKFMDKRFKGDVRKFAKGMINDMLIKMPHLKGK